MFGNSRGVTVLSAGILSSCINNRAWVNNQRYQTDVTKMRKELSLALFVCLWMITLVQSQKFTYITTQDASMDYRYTWLREIQLVSVDPDTGIYLACAIDSGQYAGQKTITYNSKTGVSSLRAESSQDPLYPPTWTAVVHWVISGAPYYPCSYGSISGVADGLMMYAVLGMGNNASPQYMSSPIPVVKDQDNWAASVVWSGDSLVTIASGSGYNVTSYLNNSLSLPGPMSYYTGLSSQNTTNKYIRYVNNNRFWVALPIYAGYTLVFKCNSTKCEQTAKVEANEFFLDANDNDEWWGCGKVLTNYVCTSSANPSNLVELNSTYADTDYPPSSTYISQCLMNTTLVLFLSPDNIPDAANYTLLALDTQDNFKVIAEKKRSADSDWFGISCLKDTIVVPHWGGYDFFNFEQPQRQVINTPVSSTTPTSSPVSDGTPANAPTTTPRAVIDNNSQTPAGTDVPLTAGLTTSLVGAAVGVGIFLLVFFLRKKQTKPEDPESKNKTDSGTTYDMLPSRTSDVGSEDISSKMLIPYKELQFNKEIGAGSFGKVFIGHWRGANVAIKSSTRSSDTEAFLAEAKLTVGLPPHPNVVLTYGVSVDSDVPYIVLEYCDGGSLDSLVFKQTIKQSQQRELVKGLAFGLYHLHSHNIVHRDLAVRNVLLHQGKPKISDFGMSRVLKEEAQGQTNSNVGPIRWMAPESIKSMTYSPKSDVWTFGIVISEIVNGHEPHFGTNQIEVACQIRDEGLTPHIPDDCDPVLKELMQMCWKMDPNQRPSMADICEVVSKKL